MSRVDMFAWLEDDIKQAEQVLGSSSRGDGSFKRRKEKTTDNKDQVRQSINVARQGIRQTAVRLVHDSWRIPVHVELL